MRTTRTGLIGVASVVVTIAALLLAAVPGPPDPSVGSAGRIAEPESRVFVCAGGIPATTMVSGSVEDGRDPDQRVKQQPLVAVMEQQAVATAYAAQSASARRWAAWEPCAEPHAEWYFVGAGARVGHDTVLRIHNPRVGVAIVDIDVYGGDGPIEAPGLHGITLPSGRTLVHDMAEVAPALGAIAIRVVARRGLVTASAVDVDVPGGRVGKPVHEWLPGQDGLRRGLTVVGIPRSPDRANLTLFNPHPQEVTATVSTIGPDGTFEPAEDATVRIPPESIVRTRATAARDAAVVALRVDADLPIAATLRSIAGEDTGFATGMRALPAVTAAAVPGGTAGRLHLVGLNRGGPVEVAGYDDAGEEVFRRTIEVPRRAAVTTALSPAVRTIRISAGEARIVAGFVYRSPRALLTAGITHISTEVLLPDVRPGW